MELGEYFQLVEEIRKTQDSDEKEQGKMTVEQQMRMAEADPAVRKLRT